MTTHEFGIFFTRTYGNGEAADDGAYGRMCLRASPVRAHRGNAADAELPLRGCQRASGWAYAAILIVPADGLRLSGELPYHAATFRGCARSQLRTRLLLPCFRERAGNCVGQNWLGAAGGHQNANI